MCGLTIPHRRLMRANHRCAVLIRQIRSACGRPARSPRLCGRCAVVRSAFSETVVYRLLSQLSHFKCSFRFKFRREMFLESDNSAPVNATRREHIPIINNSVRKTYFLTCSLNLFLQMCAYLYEIIITEVTKLSRPCH